MWECRKCGKPVFFAERKQSLGYDWHPNCLRCEECSKRLNPGQHAEHKGVPFCHHPCYGALFGPQLFGHGTRNECHTSFGKVENRDGNIKRSHVEARLKDYNKHYEGKPGELKSREVNGRFIFEGLLRIYWGVTQAIKLKEEADNRMITRRQSCAPDSYKAYHSSSDEDEQITLKNTMQNSRSSYLDQSNREYHNLEETPNRNGVSPNNLNGDTSIISVDSPTTVQRTPKGSTAIRRRPGRKMDKTRLRRRCSINGHFYLRETSTFTPPHSSSCSLWLSSLTSAEEVLNILLDKYKVEMSPDYFALYVVKDNGEITKIANNDSPLLSRVLLGPYEDASKIFIMDESRTVEVSEKVAQFLNLSLAECKSILDKYEQEENGQILNTKQKYETMRTVMIEKMKRLRPSYSFEFGPSTSQLNNSSENENQS